MMLTFMPWRIETTASRREPRLGTAVVQVLELLCWAVVDEPK